MKRLITFGACALLAACAATNDDNAPVLERTALAPATLSVEADGALRAAKATPLNVPGQQWAQRQLKWSLPDGSWVKQGDLIARFSAEESKQQLATALIEVQRSALSRATKEGELGDALGKLEVDLAQVAGQLGVAHRYAGATDLAIARNTILDYVLDEQFLGTKQDALNWRKDLSGKRGAAELALIDAQRSSNDHLAQERRADLDALELHAPHAGLLLLQANWANEKPRVGASLWAGNAFASLPDTSAFEAELSLPQAESTGIKEGLVVELAALGAPEQKVTSKLSWVAAAAQVKGRESPVKYLSMKAPVPADATEKYHWAPGQRFRARIVLLDTKEALTVANVALKNDGDAATLIVRTSGHEEIRKVQLGVRGPSRTQVLDGLKPGEEIVLNATAPAKKDKSSATATSSHANTSASKANVAKAVAP
jgi:HlyD family secretion protein